MSAEPEEIVAKLRWHAQLWRGGSLPEHAWYCDEAADEIKLLRAQLAEAAAFHGHKLEQIAAFLDGLASRVERAGYPDLLQAAAADCRAMAAKLRGKT